MKVLQYMPEGTTTRWRMKGSMGNSSSQPVSSIPKQAERRAKDMHTGGDADKKAGTRTRKRKRGSLDERSKEEQSARVLLELKNAGSLIQGHDVTEDDLAVSAQLFRENSPAYKPEDELHYEGMIQTSKRSKNKRREKERNSRASEASKEKDVQRDHGEVNLVRNEENMFNTRQSPTSPLQYMAQKAFDVSPFLNGPQNIHSLDEISSNDEDVASYLREYQDGALARSLASQNDSIDESQLTIPDSQGIDSGHAVKPLADSSFPLSPFHDVQLVNVGMKPDKRNGCNKSSKRNEKIEAPVSHDKDYGPIDPALTGLGGELMQQAAELDPQARSVSPHLLKHSEAQNVHQPSRKRKRKPHQSTTNYNRLYSDTPQLLENEDPQDEVLTGFEDVLQQQAERQKSEQGQKPGERRKRHVPVPVPALREITPPPSRDISKSNGTRVNGDKSRSASKTENLIKGPFTELEATRLQDFRDSYCERMDLTDQQFAERVQSNVRNDRALQFFWDEVCAVIDRRSRESIQKYCRRTFHNYEKRGSWTKEEDEMLKQAIELKGTQWKAVGEMVERMPEDCRDRWRNYLVADQFHNKGAWTDAEIRRLCLAVDDCMHALAEERRLRMEAKYEHRDMPEINFDAELQESKLINWAVVSQKIGGMRTRLQCSYEWKRLKNEDMIKYIKENNRLRRQFKKILTNKKPARDWRFKRSLRKVKNMLPGDKYDFLQAMGSCAAYDEENIHWRTIGSVESRAVWNTSDFKAAWSGLKKQIHGYERMSCKDVVNRLLTKLMAEESERLDEHWMPTQAVEQRQDYDEHEEQRQVEMQLHTEEGQQQIEEPVRQYKESQIGEGRNRDEGANISDYTTSSLETDSESEDEERRGQESTVDNEGDKEEELSSSNSPGIQVQAITEEEDKNPQFDDAESSDREGTGADEEDSLFDGTDGDRDDGAGTDGEDSLFGNDETDGEEEPNEGVDDHLASRLQLLRDA